jgi:hypothetical protein
MTRTTLCLLLAWLATGLGCAQKVGLIDRTQAGLLQKSLFGGEWFMRRTVIDVPYDVGYTFVGEQDDVVRVRWDIQRDQLIAYRAHPHVEGTPDSAPVAVFAIEAQVDVIREYNPATGEQSNLLVENTTDRLWYDRDYIRVDWSKNLVTNFQFFAQNLDLEPVAHYVEAADDPDRLTLGVRQPDGSWRDVQEPGALRDLEEAHYLDVVTRVMVRPEEVLIEDVDGSLLEEPACWYYLNYDCAAAQIGIRNAFLRVDAGATDYEPLAYPDNQVLRDSEGLPIRVRWTASGDRERLEEPFATGAERRPGARPEGDPRNPYATEADASLVRAQMFDKFGYFRTERYGYDRFYGEIESERLYLINRWNMWEKSHLPDGSVLPYADRGVRRIVYYLSPGFPADLRAASEAMADQWDQAFRDTVKSLTGKDPGRIFELRDNTRAVDAATGEVLRRGEAIGDLRYSHLYVVDAPTRAGLLGYGPAAADPLTGEIIAANAFIYLAQARELAATGREVVDVLNGKLDPQQLAEGGNVQAYVHLKGQPAPRPSTEHLKAFAAAHAGASPASGGAHDKANAAAKKAGLDRFKRPVGWAEARLGSVRDTSFEALLAQDPVLLASGHREEGSGARVSPLSWASPERRRRALDRIRVLARKTMDLAVFADDAVAGLALELKDQPSEVVYQTILERAFRSTAEHEVGHTLGLRHNFEGSTDALNYFPKYWELRGESPEAMAPLTEAESAGKLRELQYSSIMDYHGRFNVDQAGLGRYDRAAIKFGYGQLVEVFTATPPEPLLETVVYEDDTAERRFTLDQVLRELRHYTKIPEVLGGTAAIGARADVPYTTEVAALMGRPATEAHLAQLSGDAPWTRWEVPYRFCSDEYIYGSGTCHMFDMGADPYEVVADAVQRYWNYYWFHNFKRDRVFFDEWSYLDNQWFRIFGVLHNIYQNWVFNQWFRADTWESLRDDPEGWGIEDQPWTTALDAGLSGTAAVELGVKHLFQVLAVPEPGAYMYDFDEGYYWGFSTNASVPQCEGVWAWDTEEWCSDASLELGDARHLYSVYDVESGYYFYERLRWIGSFYDKLLALEALTDPNSFFLGVDSAESVDQWAISMYASFPDEIDGLLAGIGADRFDLFAGRVDSEGRSYILPDPFADEATQTALEDDWPIDPATSFTLQLYALWYGMAWLNANFDNSFNDGAKIWLAGSGEQITPATADDLVTFTNPLNNRIYQAIRTDAEHGLGPIMLEQAAKFAEQWAELAADPEADPGLVDYYRWRVQNITENIEVVRGLHGLYGTLVF